MYAQTAHILPLTTIRRERLLPVPGKVVVRRGQKVKAIDVVAEANLAPQHVLLSIARGLGISTEEADALIQRKPGEDVVDGDVIASRGGLARRVVRAPVSGRVVMVGEGQVLIRAEARPYQLIAGIPGVVTQVAAERGAVIETSGALIQGVWGNGRVDFGLMAVVAKEADELLEPSSIDVRMRGSVVVGGYCADEETLKTAADLSLRGLVISGLPARLLPVARRLRFPVIILEGFGPHPLNPVAFKLLASNDNREMAINAQSYDRHEGLRPEVIIPLPAPGKPTLPQDAVRVEPGKQVRVIRSPFSGSVGTVSAIRPGLMAFPSGMRTQAADVQLTDGKTIQIPIANLEILE